MSRCPGLMRFPGLKRAPVLCSYLEIFPGLKRSSVLYSYPEKLGLQTSAPITGLKRSFVLYSFLEKLPGLKTFPGLKRPPVLYFYLEKLGVQTSVSITWIQWDTLFSRIFNTIDRSLEGCGINLEMSPNFTKLLDRNRNIYRCWYHIFINNIHLLNLCPNKWLRSSRLPTMFDLVLFLFYDGNLSKDSVTWRPRRVLEVENTKVFC